jgi:hypothetical protein
MSSVCIILIVLVSSGDSLVATLDCETAVLRRYSQPGNDRDEMVEI